MALTDDNGMVMPVQPMTNGGFGGYGGYPVMPFMPYGQTGGMFGGSDSWLGILFLIALCNGGFGFGGFGGGWGGMMGMGMMGMDFLYPWLNNSQNINDGFRDAQLNDNVTSVRDAISGLSTQLCNCCGDMQLGMANGFNGVNNSIFGAQTAISQQLNSNELASLNRSFAEQTANMQGFNGIQAQIAQTGYNTTSGIADLKYTVATENCADRYEAAQNTRNIIESQTRSTQAILDKLCALELDGVKSQLAQAQRENNALQNAVNIATMRESQTAQTAQILAGQTAEVDALYNRLKNCPVGTTPVYGNQPIFTCAQNVANNNGCGCNGGYGFANG